MQLVNISIRDLGGPMWVFVPYLNAIMPPFSLTNLVLASKL